MSFLSSRSKVIEEKDYTQQLIFSNRLPESSKNKFYMLIIGVLFSLFTMNIVNAMSHDATFMRLFG